MGAQATVGIRPEHVVVRRFGDDLGANSFAARLLDTEFLGNRTAARLACEPLGIEIEAELPADPPGRRAAGAQQHGAYRAAAARAVGAGALSALVDVDPTTVSTILTRRATCRAGAHFDRDRWLTGAAVLLAVAVLIVIVALPVAALVGQSFFDRAGAFVGLANFARYIDNPRWCSRPSTASGWRRSAPCCARRIAYVYAYGLTLSCMRGKGLLRAIALMPLLAPSLLPAISLVYLFGNQGVFKGWLGDVSIYGPLGIVLGSVFWTLPHALLILTTAMATSDGRLYEAAQTLGASRWRIFRTVTLPASRYGLIVAGMVVFVLVITDFGVPKVVGGQTGVLATDIYKQVVGQQNFQMGAVVGFVLLIPAVLSFLVERRVRRRQAAALSARATPHRPEPVRCATARCSPPAC